MKALKNLATWHSLAEARMQTNWKRLGYAAFTFYCLKGMAWLTVGWFAWG